MEATGRAPTGSLRSLKTSAQRNIGSEDNEDDGGSVGWEKGVQFAEAQQQSNKIQLVTCAVVDALPVAEAAAQVACQLPHVVLAGGGCGQNGAQLVFSARVDVVEP